MTSRRCEQTTPDSSTEYPSGTSQRQRNRSGRRAGHEPEARAGGQELIVGPLGDHFTLLELNDRAALPHRAESVRHEEDGEVGVQLLERFDDGTLGGVVERAGGL